MLNWSNQFSIFCWLDNHHYQVEPHTVECLLAAGSKRMITAAAGHALTDLQHFIDQKPCWLFGHLAYDLKNETEQLSSSHPDRVGFPDLFFFEPEILVRLNETEICIDAEDPTMIFNAISNTSTRLAKAGAGPVFIRNQIDRDEYIQIIEKLQQHILRGDCYEINFCQEFYAENTVIDPVAIYRKLSAVSPNPFSALYKLNDKFLICASPERFLQRNGTHILSQPIKGTAKREKHNDKDDELNKLKLYNSSKDRSENVMVVDMVRNDLSRVCIEGSVTVNELYGIYTFPQVYQMISTVSGELRENISFSDILRAVFPMGSMTGAPKHNVLKLIEQYEKTRRGIFSGALGYITPSGDFDFNVIIRSIMYNQSTCYLSFQAGSGITFYSSPENEWEECLLKAEAIRSVLTSG